MAKFSTDTYDIINQSKYIGKGKPHWRSSWEMVFFRMCDLNPAVLQWASESITIPYFNPFTQRQTVYVPDIFMVYIDKDGNQHTELVEVKPMAETMLEAARTPKHKMAYALNQIKWDAAKKWCKANGIKFRVITEHQIFSNIKKTK